MIGASPYDESVIGELVAYLDGELSMEDVARVERRLAEESEYRETLQRLEHAWSLLDDLPRGSANANLAKSTVTLIAQTVVSPRHASSWWRPWVFGLVAMTTACCLSFLTVAQRLQTPDDDFLWDLPVIQNVDRYRNVEDLEFLRDLMKEGMFLEEESGG